MLPYRAMNSDKPVALAYCDSSVTATENGQVVKTLTITFCFTSHVKRICSIELCCVFLQEDVSPRCTNLLPMDRLTLASRSDREKAKVWPSSEVGFNLAALQTKLI